MTTRCSSGPIAVRSPGDADWFDRLILLRPVVTGWNDPARFAASSGAFPWGEALGSVSYTILALVAFAAYGIVVAWRRRGDRVLHTVVTVAAILLVWSIVVRNALDYRENNRFRVEVGHCSSCSPRWGSSSRSDGSRAGVTGDGGTDAVHPRASPVAAIPMSPSHHHGDASASPVVHLDQVHEAECAPGRHRR